MAAPPGQGPVTTCATPCTFQASALEAGKGRQEPSPTRQKRKIPCTQAVARHNERPQTIMALISRVPAPMLGTTKNFRPNARDPPRTRLNNTTSQFSLPSTGDPCIIHKNKNGPVESECKLNNVNPHIIRNQIQNQIEVTLNEHRYCKLCHYQTHTEF